MDKDEQAILDELKRDNPRLHTKWTRLQRARVRRGGVTVPPCAVSDHSSDAGSGRDSGRKRVKLSGELYEASVRITALEKLVSSKDAELGAMVRKAESSIAHDSARDAERIKALEDQLSSAKQLSTDLAEAKDQLDQATRDATNAKTAANAAMTERDEARRALAEMQDKFDKDKRVPSDAERIAALEKLLGEADEAKTQAHQRIAALEKLLGEADEAKTQAHQRIADLEKLAAKEKRRSDEYKALATRAERDASDAEGACNMMLMERDEARRAMAEMQDKLDQHKHAARDDDRIADLEDQLANAEQLAVERMHRAKVLSADLEATKADLNAARAARDKMKEDCIASTRAMEAHRADFGVAKSLMENLETQLATEKQKKKEMDALAAGATARLAQFRETYHQNALAMERDHETVKKALTTQLNTMRAKLEACERDLDDAQRKNDQLEARLF